jgi:hypothetical protein
MVSVQLHIPTALPPGKSPSMHWIKVWVETIVGLDAMAKRKKKIPSQFLQVVETMLSSL